MGVPTENIAIKNLSSTANNGIINSVELLGSKEKVSWVQNTEGLIITPSKKYPTTYAVAYKIGFKK